MKKNVLALSITAALVGLTGGAHAMTNTPSGASATVSEFNGAGIGHKLIVPYFTTQSNNNTLLNITNTDLANGKAVKVRFRGAANSDDIFDFQVFLSPGDVWTAQINQGLDGRSRFTTNDLSCTKPDKSVLNNTSFVTDRLDSILTTAQKANGTHEGYIEILNMADIPKVSVGVAAVADVANEYRAGINTTVGGDNPLYTAIKHVKGVAPCATIGAPGTGTAASSAAWAFLDANNLTYGAASPTSAASAGLLPPTTGLMANWTIINVVGAASYSGEAAAIEGRDVPGATATSPTLGTAAAQAAERVNRGNVVYWPQTAVLVDAPGASANAEFFTADALFRTLNVYSAGATNVPTPVAAASIAAAYYDLPDLSTPYNSGAATPLAQAVALSGSLATRSVRNEFITDKVITATTDWTFSQPTRRYSVAFNYGFTPVAATDDGRRFTDIFAGGVVAGAFPNAYYAPVNTIAKTDTSTTTGTNGNGRQICVTAAGISLVQYDREETKPGVAAIGVVISPSTPAAVAKLTFCGEASVLSFNNGGIMPLGTGSLKASVAVQDADVTYGDGWATITTPAASGTPIGLPVIGSAFLRAVGSSGGQTFGAQYQHRLQR